MTDNDNEFEEWILDTFGKGGGTILLTGGLILIPVAIVLAEYYLHLDAAEEQVGSGSRGKIRIASYGAIWFTLVFVFLGPIALVIKAPAIFAFISSETEFRGRWLAAQSVAWIMTATYYVAGFAYWYGRSTDIGDAIGMPLFSTAIAAFAFYFGAMGTMPHDFFAADRIGRAIHGFVACETTEGVPIRCIMAAVIFLLIAIGMWLLPAVVFN